MTRELITKLEKAAFVQNKGSMFEERTESENYICILYEKSILR